MTRQEQITKILQRLHSLCHATLHLNEDGLVCIDHTEIQPGVKEEAARLISCNMEDIVRFLSNDESLHNEPAWEKPNREANKCVHGCKAFDVCPCEKGCFSSVKNTCRFCDTSTIFRLCNLYSCENIVRHNGRMPEQNEILEHLGLIQGKLTPGAIQPDVLEILFLPKEPLLAPEGVHKRQNKIPGRKLGVKPRVGMPMPSLMNGNTQSKNKTQCSSSENKKQLAQNNEVQRKKGMSVSQYDDDAPPFSVNTGIIRKSMGVKPR